jgi:hypothetical protein
VLVFYGPGSESNKRLAAAQRLAGGRYVAFDLGYFNRGNLRGGYPMRATIDAPHPLHEHLTRRDGGEKWQRERIALRDDHHVDGPVVVVGMGKKSRAQYEYRASGWESKTVKYIQGRFPGRKVLYRPKNLNESLDGAQTIPYHVPIHTALRGASLVVCHHSNVAVDACIAGIPVICEAGAATFLYNENMNPSPAQRLDFLERLAWFQWRPSEARECWKFLLSVLA